MANSRHYLRRTNLRWIGILIILMGVFALIMIDADRTFLKYGIPIIFVGWGISWVTKKSLHTLWIEGNNLHWESTEGKKTIEGQVAIRDIQKIDLLKKGKAGKGSIQYVEVVITAKDETYTLPRNINLGGTGNPKFDDVVKKLREYNAIFDYEVIDQIDRSSLLGHQGD